MYCVYHGYPVQVHDIRTADKYTLRYFRIQGINFTTQLKILKFNRKIKLYIFSMDFKIHQIHGSSTMKTKLQHSYWLIKDMMFGLGTPEGTHTAVLE
jgi:hypothetical protein